MNQPILIIMAAGMGSRFGGLKQMAPVDKEGHILMDFSLYDAYRAGFRRVVFVITPQIEEDFKANIGERISKQMEVRYSFQMLNDLPEGFALPEGRTKPWGTAHAVLSAKNLIDAPFAVINADDYYGKTAFKGIFDFLQNEADASHHAMVGYQLGNTLTENGHVARGVCKVEGGKLIEVIERTHIEKRPEGAAYTEDGKHFHFLPADTVVSMNFWGFGLEMMDEIEKRFAGFLRENTEKNPLKYEYFIPLVVNDVLHENKAELRVLPTPDKWYGMTYAADMPIVQEAIAKMKREGEYPKKLWEAKV